MRLTELEAGGVCLWRLLTHNVSDFVRFSTWVDILPLYNFARSEECSLSELDPLLYSPAPIGYADWGNLFSLENHP